MSEARVSEGVQAEWARLLIGSFADAGVREVVISPGSRSTPWVLAASREPRLRLRTVVDERSAAFFALGQARASGKPSLLLCTSGTAGANYWPAVVEASVADLPLLVLTADRPVELQAAGANQTIDQIKLFGDFPRLFLDLGAAEADPAALRGLRRLVAQAVATTATPRPGPVHLNVRARPPLEPIADSSERGLAARDTVDALLARPIVRLHGPVRAPAPAAIADLARALDAAERPLLVAGPAPLHGKGWARLLHTLSACLGAPLLADSTSQARFKAHPSPFAIDGYGALLGQDAMAALAPDLIFQVGRGLTTTAWSRYAQRHLGCDVRVLAEHGWPDGDNVADQLLIADLQPALEALLAEIPHDAGEYHTAWNDRWRQASRIVDDAIDELLNIEGEALSEGFIARDVAAAMPVEGMLQVGNSLAIRELDLYARGRRPPIRVLAQRGASGIDGLVSTAVGAADLGQAPTVLLLGDLSLDHDLNGLQLAATLRQPFVIVVVNNDGGRIFEQLPVAELPAVQGSERMALWTTPQGRDFASAARHFGLGYQRAEGKAAFADALRAALGAPRPSLLEAVVPPSGAREQNAELRRMLTARLGALP
jgi:2-succinyl-5-enolpyruvyl-6-hydroxy-3-cyclohexene-1-carboxylate synthase